MITEFLGSAASHIKDDNDRLYRISMLHAVLAGAITAQCPDEDLKSIRGTIGFVESGHDGADHCDDLYDIVGDHHINFTLLDGLRSVNTLMEAIVILPSSRPKSHDLLRLTNKAQVLISALSAWNNITVAYSFDTRCDVEEAVARGAFLLEDLRDDDFKGGVNDVRREIALKKAA